MKNQREEQGEAAWVAALQRREAAAWDRLHRETLTRVFAYVHRHCRRREDAEDLTAEVYAAAVAAIDRFRGQASVLTWLIGIARRKLIDAARHRGRHPELLAVDLSTGGTERVAILGDGESAFESPHAALEQRETADGLRRLVQALPDAQREALLLRCVEELSLAEIARVLGRSENAIKGLLRRARTTVQEQARAAAADSLPTSQEPHDAGPLPSIL